MSFRVRVYCNSPESLNLIEKMLLRKGRTLSHPDTIAKDCYAVDFPVGGGELDSLTDWLRAVAHKYGGWLTDFKVMMTEHVCLKDCPRLKLAEVREETPAYTFKITSRD